MPQNPWFYALAGLFAGWVIQWLLDRVYLRKRLVKSIVHESGLDSRERLAARVRDLERQKNELDSRILEIQLARKSEVEALQGELEQTRVVANGRFLSDSGYAYALDESAEAKPSIRRRAATKDRLSEISGIGPAYERALWEAGILTFGKLADLTPERLGEIIDPEPWRKVDFKAWISSAKSIQRGRADE